MKDNYLSRFKKKWNIDSNFSLLVIFIVFGITGSSSVFVSDLMLPYLPFLDNLNVFLRFILKLIIVLPVYQVLLLFFGTIFGQFKFFWAFEKKFLTRLASLFGYKSKEV